MLPIAVQGRRAIWEAVNSHTGKRRIDEAFPVSAARDDPRKRNDHPLQERVNMARGRQSDAYDHLVGSPPAGVVFSEWALADPASWGYLRPILAENDGWALFITTPRGNNHAKTMYDAAANDPPWYREVSPATATGVFTPAQLEAEKREYMAQFGADQGRALYEQEYLCSFEAAVLGAFYAAELPSPARRSASASSRSTAWCPSTPPGTSATPTAPPSGSFRWSAARSASSTTTRKAAPASTTTPASSTRSAASTTGVTPTAVNGASHWLPHDVEHHELATGTSRAATLRTLGITPTVVPVAHVMDGINATRRLSPAPGSMRSAASAASTPSQAYRREWDEVAKSSKPSRSMTGRSHGADALRTFAMGFGDDSAPEAGSGLQAQGRRGEETWMSA